MQDDVNAILEPGMFVRNPKEPDWGLGQVQSNIGGKVTVNFENEGKVVLDSRRVTLIMEFLT
ncbi:MAG: DUF3553 domain-containing protein [Pseudomonadota bacterium]